ncbi:hypothetical protein [Flavobacterium sp. ov086]|uniref:hypothetical protein n=1 Tax=Flavobacterium sp. ov086 TaxID=1761785 RepID=UPI000B75760B|nr:hypothetical protein [Flavobacterium sp. ov086]SNR73837.1 hypothetical protein SAMN04487979_11920 [Flavobacterium sp. ov086]
MKKLKYIFLTLTFIILSCNYKKDKLKIKNNSTKDIYYHIILKYRDENTYYGPAVGGKIKPNTYDSPGIRGTILHEMNKNSYDKTLYIVYFNVKDRDYVYKNENTIIFNKNFYVDKYLIRELDSMDWIINYPRVNIIKNK